MSSANKLSLRPRSASECVRVLDKRARAVSTASSSSAFSSSSVVVQKQTELVRRREGNDADTDRLPLSSIPRTLHSFVETYDEAFRFIFNSPSILLCRQVAKFCRTGSSQFRFLILTPNCLYICDHQAQISRKVMLSNLPCAFVQRRHYLSMIFTSTIVTENTGGGGGGGSKVSASTNTNTASADTVPVTIVLRPRDQHDIVFRQPYCIQNRTNQDPIRILAAIAAAKRLEGSGELAITQLGEQEDVLHVANMKPRASYQRPVPSNFPDEMSAMGMASEHLDLGDELSAAMMVEDGVGSNCCSQEQDENELGDAAVAATHCPKTGLPYQKVHTALSFLGFDDTTLLYIRVVGKIGAGRVASTTACVAMILPERFAVCTMTGALKRYIRLDSITEVHVQPRTTGWFNKCPFLRVLVKIPDEFDVLMDFSPNYPQNCASEHIREFPRVLAHVFRRCTGRDLRIVDVADGENLKARAQLQRPESFFDVHQTFKSSAAPFGVVPTITEDSISTALKETIKKKDRTTKGVLKKESDIVGDDAELSSTARIKKKVNRRTCGVSFISKPDDPEKARLADSNRICSHGAQRLRSLSSQRVVMTSSMQKELDAFHISDSDRQVLLDFKIMTLKMLSSLDYDDFLTMGFCPGTSRQLSRIVIRYTSSKSAMMMSASTTGSAVSDEVVKPPHLKTMAFAVAGDHVILSSSSSSSVTSSSVSHTVQGAAASVPSSPPLTYYDEDEKLGAAQQGIDGVAGAVREAIQLDDLL
eukprot:PhM_4_TR2225/c0_g1_i1/m.60521